MSIRRPYRPFTLAEDKVVQSDRPAQEVAAELGRSAEAIYKRRHALRHGTGRPPQPWDQEHDRAILHPGRPSDAVLAERLGRSVQAIQVRRSRLNARQGVAAA